MAITIERVASPTADVAALVGALEDELAGFYASDQRHGLSLAQLFTTNVLFFIARYHGAPVGCGGVELFGDYAEVKRMFTKPSARGRGLAKALLARIETAAREAGAMWLRLETGIHQRLPSAFT